MARSFAAETAELLNLTVTDGIRIALQKRGDDTAVIGYGLSKTKMVPRPIPLAVAGKARVFLYLIHTLSLDHEQRYLTATSSTLSLYTSEQMRDDELIVGLDYTRERANEFPSTHLHVAGDRSDLDDICHGERKTRSLRSLHLPVGGRRFRPTLEDMIEFVITERMVEPRDNWHSVVKESRGKWEKIQAGAVARKFQFEAAQQLKHAGWTVTPPADLGSE